MIGTPSRDFGGQEYGDYRPEVYQEVIETQAHGRADHDVWRVADERGRAADIRREDLGKQVGVGFHFE